MALQPLLPPKVPGMLSLQDLPAPSADSLPAMVSNTGLLGSIGAPPAPNVISNPRMMSSAADPNVARIADLNADIYKRENPIAPTTPLGKIGHVAAGIGNVLGNIFSPDAMALIPGTQLYNERIEDRDADKIKEVQQQQSTADQQKGIEAQTALTEQQPALQRARLLSGLAGKVVPKGFLPPTFDENGDLQLQEDPNSQAYKSQQALQSLHQSQSDKDDALTAIAANKYSPGTPEYDREQTKINLAEQTKQIALRQLGLSADRLGFQQDKFYNPQPTGTERNKGDLATSAATQIDDMKEIVQKHPDFFGPGYGQSTAFQKWLGSEDPDAQRFVAARTIAGDHLAGTFGGRSEAALSALDNALGQFKDNPKAALAGLDQLAGANKTFITAGQLHGKSGALKPNQASQPSADSPKIRKFNVSTGRLE